MFEERGSALHYITYIMVTRRFGGHLAWDMGGVWSKGIDLHGTGITSQDRAWWGIERSVMFIHAISVISIPSCYRTNTTHPPSHGRPLDGKRANIIPLWRLGVLPSDHVRLLRPRAQATTAHNVQQVELLVPAQSSSEEVAVVSQRIAGVDRVVAAEAEAGHEEVAARVQEAE